MIYTNAISEPRKDDFKENIVAQCRTMSHLQFQIFEMIKID